MINVLKNLFKKDVVEINEESQKNTLFNEQYENFKEMSKKDNRFDLKDEDLFPCLNDNTNVTTFDHHYVYHPAWAARIIAKNNPEFHVDISSTLRFCSILSAFIPVKFYDYRPAQLNLSNLECLSADLLKLPFEDNSIKSLSCMHTLEHVGLGRYGDKLDPNGDLVAIEELKRVTAEDGALIIVVPITGSPKIKFNAHRIYSYKQIMNYFSGFELVQFDLIPDSAQETGMIFNASEADSNKQDYGCGCFYFKKISDDIA